jgi:hypothetical protein
MDIAAIEERLESGESLKIKYRYPIETNGHGPHYGVRSDRLLDVSTELNRFYTLFRGEIPVWLEADDILELCRDDGDYRDFPGD